MGSALALVAGDALAAGEVAPRDSFVRGTLLDDDASPVARAGSDVLAAPPRPSPHPESARDDDTAQAIPSSWRIDATIAAHPRGRVGAWSHADAVLPEAMSKNRAALLSLSFAVICTATGCDDPPPAASSATATAAATTPKPAPTPTPTAAPKPSAKPPRECGPGPEVTFDEPVMEKQIRAQLQKPEGPIKRDDLAKVKTLNLTEAKSDDALDPCIFPYLTGIKGLYLAKGNLEDLHLLAGLKTLESLRVSMTEVKDLSPLAGLTKLDRLDIGRTQVADLKPIETLQSLTELSIDETQVTDLTSVGKLAKLEMLEMKRTRIKDLTPLKDLKNLKMIYIEGSPIDDTTVLKGISGLKIVQAK